MIRHGQTSRNLENRVLGRSDLPLDETGLSQAAKAGKELADIQFDAVYSSPMRRAMQTAQAIKDANQYAFEIQPESSLIEQNFGVFEGVPRDDAEYQKEKHLYFKPFEGGESFLDVAARVYNLLDSLQKKHGEDDKVLLVAHGGICRVIENYFHGMDNDTFASFFMKNCEVRSFDTADLHRDALVKLDDKDVADL